MTGCSCKACVSMCRNRPGIPSPSEARELLRVFPDRMMSVVFSGRSRQLRVESPAIRGKEGKTVSGSDSGTCTFFRKGRCELHGTGLKPQECREADHNSVPLAARERVLEQWAGAPISLTGN